MSVSAGASLSHRASTAAGADQTAAANPCDRVQPSDLWLKGAIDRYAAAMLLLICAPLFGLLMFLIRRDSPGDAIFRQVRAGRAGRPFWFYKFRTMRTDSDPYGDSPQTKQDPRITRIGRWLRETSLDELPQLLNVLKGEMSLVGPRPLYLQQAAEWSERHRARLWVKPGLTGLAQVNGRAALTLEEKLEWDIRYVQAVCLRVDLQILWRTIRNLWSSGGIYELRYSQSHERRSGR